MDYHYGIDICHETLRRLSTASSIDERIFRAFDEFEVATEDDFSPDHWRERNEILARYGAVSPANFTNAGGKAVDPTAVAENLALLAEDLVNLCVDIIIYNTEMLNEADREK